MRGYRNVGIGILAHDLTGHIGAIYARRPAASRSADSSKRVRLDPKTAKGIDVLAR